MAGNLAPAARFHTAPDPMKLYSRDAHVDDANVVCELVRCSIINCCRADHGNDPQLLETWLSNKTPGNFRQWIEAEGNFGVVVEADNRLAGFALCSGSGEILLCYVAPEFMHCGIGRVLLGHLESQARNRRLCHLHTTTTRSAEAFYARNGFLPAEVRRQTSRLPGKPLSKNLDSAEPGKLG